MLIFDLVLATRRREMTGVERYGVNLFEAMRKLQPGVVAFARDTDAFADPTGIITVPNIYGGWATLPLEIRRRGLKATAVIFPTAPASPLFLPMRTPLCRIIHDAFPWSAERAMPWRGRLLYRYGEDLMARRYKWLLGTTEPVAAELRPLFGRPGIDCCGNATGLDVNGQEREPPGVPREFVLAVGTVEPRKDYARLIKLVDSAPDNALPVVLVGRPGWGDAVAAVEDLAARQPTRFVWLRELPDEGLLWLYRRAACFLSLSRAEGFNMPLVESAMCARPVICSNIPIHRSVAPPWARFAFDDSKPSELWCALRAAAAEPPAPQAVDEYRQRYAWERVASRLLEILAD
jgi:glycosyltransferase involved in cell wall biosynthesis